MQSGMTYVHHQETWRITQQECRKWTADYLRARPELSTAFLLEDKKDIVLDFGGATLQLCGMTKSAIAGHLSEFVQSHTKVCSFTSLSKSAPALPRFCLVSSVTAH